jgi:hypothetical protein
MNTNDFTNDDTPTEADLNECYGSKYLGAVDLGDKKIRTRIAKTCKEAMRQQDGKERPKIVAYFTTLDKPLVLNATNKDRLVDGLGRIPANWEGAEVGLYTEATQYGGRPTRGVRLTVLSAPAAAVKRTPQPAPKPAAAEEPTAWDAEDLGHPGKFTEAAE